MGRHCQAAVDDLVRREGIRPTTLLHVTQDSLIASRRADMLAHFAVSQRAPPPLPTFVFHRLILSFFKIKQTFFPAKKKINLNFQTNSIDLLLICLSF